MSYIKTRKFSNGDEVELFNVFLSSINSISSHFYTQEQIEAWAPKDIDYEQWSSHIRTLKPFIAETDGKIVGYADIQDNGYIDHFYVSGSCQRQGIGGLLMERIQAEAVVLGIEKLTSNVSTAAESFFLKHGFFVVERRFPIRRGVMLQNALMKKFFTKQ